MKGSCFLIFEITWDVDEWRLDRSNSGVRSKAMLVVDPSRLEPATLVIIAAKPQHLLFSRVHIPS